MASQIPGALIFILIVAAVATVPASLLILWRYKRAVLHSMREHHGAAGDAAAIPTLGRERPRPLSGDAASLVRALHRRPWHAAAAYAFGGLVYAVIMAVIFFLATGIEIGPYRLALFTIVYLWPVVLVAGIVGVPSRPTRVAMAAAYFIVLLAVTAAGLRGQPQGSVVDGFTAWAASNALTSILLVPILGRRIRAVAPFAFLFMLACAAGAAFSVFAAGSSQEVLMSVANPLFEVGLGPRQVMSTIALSGVLIMALAAWGAHAWIRRRYERKAFSDEAAVVVTIWLIFTLEYGVALMSENMWWLLAGLVPFAAMASTTFPLLRRRPPDAGSSPRLLLLRSFSIGREGERLFDLLQKHWRRAGSIQLIAGPDLATKTVEVHELLEFVSGRLAKRFITSQDVLAVRLGEMDTAPDRDGRFRVNDFFCDDDHWREVLAHLVRECHVVMMDLRGFTRDNAGCIFEIRELFRAVPLAQVIFVVNRQTDRLLLDQTCRDAAAAVSSPDEPRILEMNELSPPNVRRLLESLAQAAYRVSTSPTAQPRPSASRLK